MPVKELRDELRTLRKESIKPVSKMGFKDISAEIERLKVSREETPPVASTTGGSLKQTRRAVESVKEVVAEVSEAVQKVKVKSIATAPKKESLKEKEKEKPKKTISPEHLAKMKAGRLAKKV
jgi:bisphosphoglycerate-independent phosphoglycerate mutase (AlkP superfamily)